MVYASPRNSSQRYATLCNEHRNERMGRRPHGPPTHKNRVQLSFFHDPDQLFQSFVHPSKGHTTACTFRSRNAKRVRYLQKLEAPQNSSLQHLPSVCPQDGPPLSVARKLRRIPQFQGFFSVLSISSSDWTLVL